MATRMQQSRETMAVGGNGVPIKRSITDGHVVTITPVQAAEWLARNAANRRIRERKVQQFAKLIRDGQWQVTHQGIAFAEDGSLLDGQHRLLAITRAGIPVQVMVTTGLAKHTVYAMDCGTPRNLEDLSGAVGCGLPLSQAAVAIGRAMIRGFSQMSTTTMEERYGREAVLQFLIANRERIEQCRSLVYCCKDTKHATVAAVLGKASYHICVESITGFAAALTGRGTGEARDHNGALLRLLVVRERGRMCTRIGYLEVMSKGTAAIKAYHENRPLTVLRCIDRDPYPTPGLD